MSKELVLYGLIDHTHPGAVDPIFLDRPVPRIVTIGDDEICRTDTTFLDHREQPPFLVPKAEQPATETNIPSPGSIHDEMMDGKNMREPTKWASFERIGQAVEMDDIEPFSCHFAPQCTPQSRPILQRHERYLAIHPDPFDPQALTVPF